MPGQSQYILPSLWLPVAEFASTLRLSADCVLLKSKAKRNTDTRMFMFLADERRAVCGVSPMRVRTSLRSAVRPSHSHFPRTLAADEAPKALVRHRHCPAIALTGVKQRGPEGLLRRSCPWIFHTELQMPPVLFHEAEKIQPRSVRPSGDRVPTHLRRLHREVSYKRQGRGS